MIYDPVDLNYAFDDDGTPMVRVLVHDLADHQGEGPATGFVPMTSFGNDFTRPAW